MRAPVVWMLGLGQCVYWGVSYYAFSVLLVPMRVELGVSDAALAGAFSLGLGMNALLSVMVGHWLDRGHGPRLLRFGALSAAALLWVWSGIQTLAGLYAVWLGLGACMALVLYEMAFALVTRAMGEPIQRLRALASVTVMGGLASTIFIPITGICVSQLGWRATLRVLVVVWLIMTVLLERYVQPALRGGAAAVLPSVHNGLTVAPDRRLVFLFGAPMLAATFAAMALTTLVIPTLVARGHSIASSPWVLAALGIAQLPGRIWLWCGSGNIVSTRSLLVVPLLLQACGLFLLAVADNLYIAFAGVAIFGVGAGLHTLARPWVVPQWFGIAAAGRVNGTIARAQGIARAMGPFVAAGIYEFAGSTAVFLTLAALVALLAPMAFRTSLCLAITADVDNHKMSTGASHSPPKTGCSH
jgi:hypothetical protein